MTFVDFEKKLYLDSSRKTSFCPTRKLLIPNTNQNQHWHTSNFLLMYTCVQRDISMIVSLKIYAFVKIKDQWKLSRWRQLSIRFMLTSALKSFHVDVSFQFVSRWHQLSNSFTLTSALKSFQVDVRSQILSRWRHLSNPVTITPALKSFQGDTSPKMRSRWRQLSSPFTFTSALKSFPVYISS